MSRSVTLSAISVSNPRQVWLISVAHAVNEFYSVALPPILPLLVNEFAISYGEAGALLTIFFVTYSVFQLPAGILADRFGQRLLLVGGMITLSVGILLAAGAQDYWILVIAEVIAGIGGSTYHPAGMSLISDLETGSTEGKAMGIHGFGGVVGTALAPALIGGIAAFFHWRLALTIAATIGVIYAFVFFALFREVDPEPIKKGIGHIGKDCSNENTNTNDEHSGSRRYLLSGLVSVPLERWVAVLFVANLSIAAEIGAIRTFVTSYLVEHAGTSTVIANSIFFVMLVGAGVSSLGAGSLSDTIDRPTFGFITMTISAIVLGSTVLIPLASLSLFVWFFLLGVVLWAAVPTMNAITSEYSEQTFSGSLFGVLVTAGSLGGAAGPLLFGIAAERFGLGAAFPLVAGISIFGAVAFLMVSRF